MGKIQCVALKSRQGSFQFIERYLNNMNTPLEKKIYEEYIAIKSYLNSKKRITSEKEQLIYQNYKLRKQRFIKWYKMANIDLNDNMISDGKYNIYNFKLFQMTNIITISKTKINLLLLVKKQITLKNILYF